MLIDYSLEKSDAKYQSTCYPEDPKYERGSVANSTEKVLDVLPQAKARPEFSNKKLRFSI